ncbi:zinc finger protein 182 [Manduca sexta]|uniref:zinc finger protein 182 n=1 Tax=Manduca sexta TaxID=7130 RepID=UPI00188F9877|nr:zinc finger protein 182 [Manduca sexta]
MDFVKREDQNAVDEDYKIYMDGLPKHQLESEYQHMPISMEQLHQAMQSSLNSSVHNFQLPLSPRQVSLMLKSNQLSRNLNFQEVPANLHRDDMGGIELHPSLRHDDVLSQNLSRNLDISLVRNLGSELELQGGLAQTLVQNINEQDLSRSLDLARINDVSVQNLPHNLSHDMLSHLNRQHLEQDILTEDRRTPIMMDSQLMDQNLVQRLGQNLEQNLTQRLGQNLDRLDQRLISNVVLNERQLEPTEHLLPMPFHIKSEQEDDGYFYDNMNQGINGVNELNGQIQPEHSSHANIHTDSQIYAPYNHVNLPALNPIDLYTRPQNYIQNYAPTRDNPQNLVVHKQFDIPFTEEIKKQEEKKTEEPKENMKPNDNKMYYAEYNQNFNDKQEIKVNPEELSMNIKGEYICFKCNEIFPSKRGLKQHAKLCTESESGENGKVGKFGCTQCAYRCQSPAILKIHERTHSGEKPFSCTFCDYKSGQKNNVAKHILVHMKEKPFRCQFCDYRCAQKNNLVVHERTHTGYKPFACPYCDYRTVQKPNLVKHMYLHTDQKPFSCDMCSYRCVQKTNLTKHKQRHLNEKDGDSAEKSRTYKPRQKSIKCRLCPYRCVQKSSLDKHFQAKHAGFEDPEGLKSDGEIQNLSVKKDFTCEEKEMEQS